MNVLSTDFLSNILLRRVQKSHSFQTISSKQIPFVYRLLKLKGTYDYQKGITSLSLHFSSALLCKRKEVIWPAN